MHGDPEGRERVVRGELVERYFWGFSRHVSIDGCQ